jgi:hypothetical protein
MDTPRDEQTVKREEDRAGAEAAEIGGPDPEYQGDEESRPLEEAGAGEAEGFELAERDLVEHASHGDHRSSPRRDPFEIEEESELSSAVYGEPDEVDPTEVTRDPREGPDDPGEGPGIAAER